MLKMDISQDGTTHRVDVGFSEQEPGVICWGDGEYIPWEEYRKIKAKEVKEDENK